jgi:internalin A
MSLEITLERIRQEKKEPKGKLDLSFFQLGVIPIEVTELKHIHTIKLPFNNLSDLSTLEKLTGLTSLHLSNNNLSDLSTLEKLTGLTSLDLSGNNLSNLSPLEKLTGLTSLRLSSNNISDVSSLEKLTELTDLDLSNNNLSDLSTLEKLTGLTSLRLSSNNISDVSTLEKLTELTDLDLSNSNLSDLSTLEKLTGLTSLRLSSNNISDVSSLEKLTELTDLDLSNSNLSDLSTLEKLTGLTSLDLSGNNLSDLSSLEKLTGLTNLHLSSNNLSDLSTLEKLPGLTNLHLSSNNLSDLSTLEKLTGLTSLDLSGNNLSDLSTLEKLTGLTSLRLSSNNISDVSSLEKLTELTDLDLMINVISDVAPLGKLTNLDSLDLDGNKISDLTGIEKLTKLIRLDLRNNRISDTSDLKSLTNLQYLDIQYNYIEDASPLLTLIKNHLVIGGSSPFHGLVLDNNPLENPPQVILKKGHSAVLDWFEQLEKGSAALFESKVMLLGQGGAGKTTLTNLLLDDHYEVEEGKEESTLGISIHKNRVFSHTSNDDIKIKGHLWDFGGQDIQKMLHQFFITENCLYIIVHDKRKENTNFDYWFQIIDLLGPKSSVLVLENPKSMSSNNYDFPITKYRESFPGLSIKSHEINLKEINQKNKAQWAAFLDDVSSELSELKIVNRVVPAKWSLVRDALNDTGKKHISKDEFYGLCRQPSIDLSETYSDLCLHYLAGLGELVYYDENNLANRIYLDQNWLTKGLYYILSDPKIKERGGSFTRQQAYESWGQHDYNEDEKQMLLSLLLKAKFDICYSLNDSDTYITPILLPSDKIGKWDKETHLHFRYQYSFMPHGMFSRLIVRLHEKIDSNMKWEFGVRLTDGEKNVFSEVQKTLNKESGQQVIDIRISGERYARKDLLSFVRREIEQIHNDFLNIKFEEKIACNCTKCEDLIGENKEPSFFNYAKLKAKIEKGKYFEECEHANFNEINIGSILSNVVIERAGEDNLDSQFLHKIKELDMTLTQITQNNTNNQSMNNSGNSSANAQAKATAKAESSVSIEINNMLGETESLLEDIEDERVLLEQNLGESEVDTTVKDISKVNNAIKAIDEATKANVEPATKDKNRLRRFFDALGNEESAIHKTFKGLRNGRDYGVSLAEGYNKIAENIGLPLVPPAALDLIKVI